MKHGFNDVEAALANVRKSGSGYSARCPSHDDRRNSLSLKRGDNGTAMLFCHAGCSYQDIMSAINLPEPVTGAKKPGVEEAVFDYTDENGEVLYQNVRFARKEFRQRHFDASGKAVWGLNGTRRVPYRLPNLAEAAAGSLICMAEGEKDADRLASIGLIATNHKVWRPEFNHLLKGRDVVIFCDHDHPGIAAAEKVLGTILADAGTVKVIDCFENQPVPDKHGRDVSDYLDANDPGSLLSLIENAAFSESLKGTCNPAGLRVIRMSDVVAQEVNWLWKPFIPIGEFTIMEGIEGLGKSWASCAIAHAVAGGHRLPFDGDTMVEAANVLLLSAEDSLGHTVKPRLISLGADMNKIFAVDAVFSLHESEHLKRFEDVVERYRPRLVVLDPMFSFTGNRDLNKESDSRPIAQKLIALAQKYDCAIVGIRHVGKSKGNGDARNAGLGSVAWRASARSVLLVGRDEETGERAICQTKSNLAEESKVAVGFEIGSCGFGWKSDPSRLTKERMLAQPKNEDAKAEQSEAEAFLTDFLRDGERPSKDVEKEARELGIASYSLRKARKNLGILSAKKGGNFGGDNRWMLKLPETAQNPKGVDLVLEDVGRTEIRHLQQSASIKTSYSNGLAEDAELETSQHLQVGASKSSIKNEAYCDCGSLGIASKKCADCGEIIISF